MSISNCYNFEKKEYPRVDASRALPFLHTVVIPASLGDETGSQAPENGADHNAIWHYEANDSVYIYDASGVYTRIK